MSDKYSKMWDLGLPHIIYGTHKRSSDQIAMALSSGYDLLDTATGYNNENDIKQAIIKSGISPLILTKFNPTDFKKGIKEVSHMHNNALGVEPDLILLHTPLASNEENLKAYQSLCQVYEQKLCGVSNFSIDQIQYLLDNKCQVDVVSLEYSPFYQPNKLVDFCLSKNIYVTGYRPLRSFTPDKYLSNHLSPCQIFKWMISKKVIPIVSSGTQTNIESNLKFNKAILDTETVIKLNNANMGEKGSTCMLKYCKHDE